MDRHNLDLARLSALPDDVPVVDTGGSGVDSPTLGAMRWMSSDGQWVVVLVHLTNTGNGRDGDWLRVSHRGFFVGEARDWTGVVRLGVDVSDLRPFRSANPHPYWISGWAGKQWRVVPAEQCARFRLMVDAPDQA